MKARSLVVINSLVIIFALLMLGLRLFVVLQEEEIFERANEGVRIYILTSMKITE